MIAIRVSAFALLLLLLLKYEAAEKLVRLDVLSYTLGERLPLTVQHFHDRATDALPLRSDGNPHGMLLDASPQLPPQMLEPLDKAGCPRFDIVLTVAVGRRTR